MPFLDKDEIAKMYHEAAEERKKAEYFKTTYLEQKEELDYYRKYKKRYAISLILLIITLSAVGGYFVTKYVLEMY